MATVITTVGRKWVRDSLTGGTAPTTADYVAWGTGVVGASTTSTALSNETSTGISMAGETRVLATRSLSGNDVIRWQATLTANATRAVTEAGNFTGSGSASPGILVTMGDFSAVNLSTNDSIAFDIQLRIA